jgi:hypothetical protein
MSKRITYNLTENALDYLILAGEQAKEGSPRMTKHALASLADGVELLLKARLAGRAWCLIFKDVDQATRHKYKTGDFQSVTFDQARDRLKNLCGVEIPSQHLTLINDLRQLRNRIRHFAFAVDHRVAISLITKTLCFAIDFVNKHLEPTNESLRNGVALLRTMLGQFEEFVAERFKQIQAEMREWEEAAFTFIECPMCLQPALYAMEGRTRCFFCGHKQDGEGAARDWATRLGGYEQVENCPCCGVPACVRSGEADESEDGTENYLCLSCGNAGEYKHCSKCDCLHADSNPADHCDDCWEYLCKRNDLNR